MGELLSALALAAILAGETPGCPFDAKVAGVQVMENREAAGIVGGWFGEGTPTADDWLAVRWASELPDLVDEALYFIGPGDAERMDWLEVRTGRWVCDGTWVEAWR